MDAIRDDLEKSFQNKDKFEKFYKVGIEESKRFFDTWTQRFLDKLAATANQRQQHEQ